MDFADYFLLRKKTYQMETLKHAELTVHQQEQVQIIDAAYSI